MRSNRKHAFGYTVSRPRLPTMPKPDEPGSVFSYTEEDIPKLKSVTFFGAMTRDECKTLALLLASGRHFEMKIPHNFEHAGFHGDTLTLTSAELAKHLRDYFGDLDRLPDHCVLSLEKFLTYLRDEILPGVSRAKNTNKKF